MPKDIIILLIVVLRKMRQAVESCIFNKQPNHIFSVKQKIRDYSAPTAASLPGIS